MSDKCVFCDIANRPGQPSVVQLAPLNPVAEGHMLFLPRAHYRDAVDNPGKTAEVMKAAATYAQFVGACNIITSVGEEATQSVFHLHIHVVPRRKGDGLKLPWTGQKTSPPGGQT